MSDLRQQLELLGVDMAGPTDKHYSDGWINVRCPFCSSSKRLCGISEENYSSHCWKCGKHSTASVILGNHPHIDRAVLNKVLASRRPQAAVELPVHTGRYTPPSGLVDLTAHDRSYLDGRGFDPDEIVRHWGVRSYQRQRRLFIPIHEASRPISWTSRATSDFGPRYKTATSEQSACPLGTIIYGLDYVSHTCVIVEGPTDAWAVGPGAVAVLGLSFTAAQVQRLAQVPRKVICFDSSPQAQRRAEALALQLSELSSSVHIVQLETGDDPAEADAAELMELRQQFLGG